MKKIVSTALAAILMMALAACGGQPKTPQSSSSSSAPQSSSSQQAGEPSPDEDTPLPFDPTAKLPEAELSSVMTNFASLTAGGLIGEENLCYSPASLYFALSLVSTGAAGDTQSQLFELLGVPEDGAALLGEEVKAAMDAVTTLPTWFSDEYTEAEDALYIANSVWLNESLTLNADFGETAQQYWDASLLEVPMGTDATKEMMRQWVLEKTNNFIDTTVETNPDDVMVLFNALYLAAGWPTPFDAGQNVTDDFTLPDGSAIQAEYMTRSYHEYYYDQGDGYMQASLRFRDSSNIHFVLPDEDVPLSRFTSPERLNHILRASYDDKADINLRLPKFDFSNSMELRDVLSGLGVENAFDQNNADFTGLTAEAQPAYLSKVLQDTRITIDEEGVEAAAVTVIPVAPAALPVEPEEIPEIDFFLDRPFLFFIENNGYPLFIGVVSHPTEA